MYSIREQVIQALGEKCQECGWSKDLRAISVVDTSSESRLVREHISRDKFYINVMKEVKAESEHPYRALCANCRMIWQLDQKLNRQPKVNVVLMKPPLVVWTSELGRADTFQNHQWLDNYVMSGYQAYIKWNGQVSSYPSGLELYPDWRAFAAAQKISKDLPSKAVMVYER
jgi:hypothetical protein